MKLTRPDPGTVSSRRGFTLVELLVVIGIIALLISILLPTLGKAQESARQVKCLSNLKQLANATVQYLNDSKGVMPAPAPFGGPNFHRAGDPTAGSFDYLNWYRIKDPITGQATPAGAGASENQDMQITDSALAKYLGNGGDALEQVFRCPSDDPLVRPNSRSPLPAICRFRYSYSMNVFVASKVNSPKKVSRISNTSQKILYICEDERTLDDGNYNPNPLAWATGPINGVASRHRIKKTGTRSALTNSGANEDCLGNVSFVDGHAEIFGRKDALRQKYTGNPAADPAGF
jgi:prepilin-type N-terminal cleavage/methylation domain-containing protein/prepilin-type processing-associated H-X9-DG protein